MTFRPSAPNKRRRWLALLAIVVLATGIVGVGTALAVPSFTFVPDVQGPNDEPGQKDLTSDASAFDGSDFYTAWKWDDTSWSGKNTGDACSLFDTTADGRANYAVCVTVGKPAAEKSTRVYSCTDTRSDRCTGATLVGTEAVPTTSNWCTVTGPVAGPFDVADTQATCNISLIGTELSLSGLGNANFLNSCSYPSQEPNSDPSDCVHQIANQDVTVNTDSTGSAITSWSVTVKDTATLTPAGTGSVTFALYSDSTCTTLVTGSSSTDLTSPFAATDVVITNSDVTGSGPWTFYWKVTYTPGAGFNAPAPLCDEQVTITASAVGTNTAP